MMIGQLKKVGGKFFGRQSFEKKSFEVGGHFWQKNEKSEKLKKSWTNPKLLQSKKTLTKNSNKMIKLLVNMHDYQIMGF